MAARCTRWRSTSASSRTTGEYDDGYDSYEGSTPGTQGAGRSPAAAAGQDEPAGRRTQENYRCSPRDRATVQAAEQLTRITTSAPAHIQ